MKVRCFLVTLSVSLCCHALNAQESITVVSYGGSYAKACVDGYHKAFEEETGIKINLEDYNGGLAQVRAQIEAGNVSWDVVDMESPDVLVACDEGLIELIDDLELPDAPDGTPASEDFYPGTNTECSISMLFYATVVAFNTEQLTSERPTQIADLFDLEKFPGRRGLQRSPRGNLEFALLADGVPVEEIYEVLSTKEGMAQAFAKLDTIKDEIIWWETGAQPPQFLADQEVTMTTAWNGRIFNAQVLENQPFEILWDGRLLDHGGMVIVSDAPNMENARKFIEFGARTNSMIGVSSRIAYSPTRRSAVNLIDKHIPTGVSMSGHMPVHPDLKGRAITLNIDWWADRFDQLNERFASWLSR